MLLRLSENLFTLNKTRISRCSCFKPSPTPLWLAYPSRRSITKSSQTFGLLEFKHIGKYFALCKGNVLVFGNIPFSEICLICTLPIACLQRHRGINVESTMGKKPTLTSHLHHRVPNPSNALRNRPTTPRRSRHNRRHSSFLQRMRNSGSSPISQESKKSGCCFS